MDCYMVRISGAVSNDPFLYIITNTIAVNWSKVRYVRNTQDSDTMQGNSRVS